MVAPVRLMREPAWPGWAPPSVPNTHQTSTQASSEPGRSREHRSRPFGGGEDLVVGALRAAIPVMTGHDGATRSPEPASQFVVAGELDKSIGHRIDVVGRAPHGA